LRLEDYGKGNNELFIGPIQFVRNDELFVAVVFINKGSTPGIVDVEMFSPFEVPTENIGIIGAGAFMPIGKVLLGLLVSMEQTEEPGVAEENDGDALQTAL
jgi:hypothetical protein